MKALEILKALRAGFEAAGSAEPEAEAREAATWLLDCALSQIYLDPGREAGCEQRVRELISRRAAGEPLAYIIGERWFYGRRFHVEPGVLIPRAETELVCERACEMSKKGARVLDMCTGSGCIAATLSLELETEVTAADISEAALAIASDNARALGARVRTVRSDMFRDVTGVFDIIVSNPPYIPAGEIPGLAAQVAEHEPYSALCGGESGLDFYRIIARCAPGHLVRGGALVLELGDTQAAEVSAMLAASGFCDIEVRRDYGGIERVLSGRRSVSADV